MTATGRTRDWGALLAAAQAGDARAYREFLTTVTPFVRALARRRIRAEDVAEDVVQDSLLTLHRIRHTYEPGRPVEPWLAAIVSRRSIDALRRVGRQTAREAHDPLAYETFADPAANRNEVEEDASELASMLPHLPPRQREALTLTKLQQM